MEAATEQSRRPGSLTGLRLPGEGLKQQPCYRESSSVSPREDLNKALNPRRPEIDEGNVAGLLESY